MVSGRSCGNHEMQGQRCQQAQCGVPSLLPAPIFGGSKALPALLHPPQIPNSVSTHAQAPQPSRFCWDPLLRELPCRLRSQCAHLARLPSHSSQPSRGGTNPSRHPKRLHWGHTEVPSPCPHLQDGPAGREGVLQPVPVPISTGHTAARAQPQLPEGSSPQQPGRHPHREPPAATAHLDWDGTGNELGVHSRRTRRPPIYSQRRDPHGAVMPQSLSLG